MSVLKQCSAEDHFSDASNKSRSLHRPSARTDHADPLERKPEEPWTKRSTFLEDFTVEHTLSELQIASIEMPGSFSTATAS
jgi:hypothetical protein